MEEESNKPSDSNESDYRANIEASEKLTRTRTLSIPKKYYEKKRSFISTKWRWLILIAIGMIRFGPYFCEYNMNALSMELNEKFFGENFKYNILHPITSLCGILSAIVSGILISKKKLGFSIILCSVTIILSQILLTIVGYLADNQDKNSPKTLIPKVLIIVSYSLFGFGAEGSQVCQMSIIGMWFEKQEISTGFGIILSVLRISTLMNLIVTIGHDKIAPTFLTGFILCIISFIFGVISIIINAYSKKIDIKRKVYFEDDEEQEFHWRNMFNFGWSFWILCIKCAAFYSSLFAFNFFSTDLICQKYDVCGTHFLTQYVFLGSILVSPIFGYITDLYGYKVSSLAMSGAFLMVAHLLNATLPSSLKYWCLVSLILMTISSCLCYVTFWPSISLITNYEMIGFAYGVCISIQNCGLFIFPFVSSIFIYDGVRSDKYQNIEIILSIFAFIAFISSITLWRVDKKMYCSILQRQCLKIIKQPSNDYGIIDNHKRSYLNQQEKSSLIYHQ